MVLHSNTPVVTADLRAHLVGLVIFTFAGVAGAQDKPQDPTSFFGLGHRWDVKLTVTAENLDKLYPIGGVRIGLSQRGRFDYVKGDIEIAGHEFRDVGLRFKGNSTYWSTGGHLKKSFKVDFNRFVKDEHFLGLKKINLHNNVTDPSQIREAVSHQVYRDAGVPACRTCFARVYLTVVGKFENEYLGNYTIVEQIDRQFLAHNFADRNGLIVKPEGRIMPFLGDDWNDDYDKAYIPKTSVKTSHARPLIEMARLIAQSDDKVLADGIEKVLDVSEFLNYCAVTTYIGNQDSPFMLAHNFYMAVPAGSAKVVWLPWDLNLSLGGFGMGRSRQAGSIYRPTSMPLFTRLLSMPKYRKIYEKHLTKLAKGPGSPKAMAGYLALARKMTAEGIASEADRSDAIMRVEGDRSGFLGLLGNGLLRNGRTTSPASVAASQDRYVAGRAQVVLDQLAGEFDDRPAPTNMFAGFGRTRTPTPRAPMVALRDMLVRSKVVKIERTKKTKKNEKTKKTKKNDKKETLVDGQALEAAARKLFGKIDRDQSGTMSRGELMALLRSQRGQDASRSEARRILRTLDADKNRSLSETEWVQAYAAGFGEWDVDEDGKLSDAELTGR